MGCQSVNCLRSVHFKTFYLIPNPVFNLLLILHQSVNVWVTLHHRPVQGAKRVTILNHQSLMTRRRKSATNCTQGDSDVGDFMMVTDFRCWWHNHYVDDFFRYVDDFLNVLNRSLTSQTCHQHIWSPTSVTNIDVTVPRYDIRSVIYRNKRIKFVGQVPNSSLGIISSKLLNLLFPLMLQWPFVTDKYFSA